MYPFLVHALKNGSKRSENRSAFHQKGYFSLPSLPSWQELCREGVKAPDKDFNRRSDCWASATIPWKMEFWISSWFIQKHNYNEAHNPNFSSLDPSQAEIPTGCTPISGRINPPYQGSTNSDFDKNQNLCFIWSIFWEYIITWTKEAI